MFGKKQTIRVNASARKRPMSVRMKTGFLPMRSARGAEGDHEQEGGEGGEGVGPAGELEKNVSMDG